MRFTLFAAAVLLCAKDTLSTAQMIVTDDFKVISLDDRYLTKAKEAIEKFSALLSKSYKKTLKDTSLDFEVEAEKKSFTVSGAQAQWIIDFLNNRLRGLRGYDIWLSDKTVKEKFYTFTQYQGSGICIRTGGGSLVDKYLNLHTNDQINNLLKPVVREASFEDKIVLQATVEIKDGTIILTKDSKQYTLDRIHIELIQELAMKGSKGNEQYAFIKTTEGSRLLLQLWKEETWEAEYKRILAIVSCLGAYQDGFIKHLNTIPRAPRGKDTYEFDILGEPGKQYIRSYFYPGDLKRVFTAGQTTKEVRCALTEEIAAQIIVLQNTAKTRGTAVQLILDAVSLDGKTRYNVYVQADNDKLSIVNVTPAATTSASQITFIQDFEVTFLENEYLKRAKDAINKVSALLPQKYTKNLKVDGLDPKAYALEFGVVEDTQNPIPFVISPVQAERIIDFRNKSEPTIKNYNDSEKPATTIWIEPNIQNNTRRPIGSYRFVSNYEGIRYEITENRYATLNDLELKDYSVNWLYILSGNDRFVDNSFLQKMILSDGNQTQVQDAKLIFSKGSETFSLDYMQIKLIKELGQKSSAKNDEYAFMKNSAGKMVLLKIYKTETEIEVEKEKKTAVRTTLVWIESYDKPLLEITTSIPRAPRGKDRYEFDILGEPGKQYIRSYFYPGDLKRVFTAGQTTKEVRCALTEEIAAQIIVLQNTAKTRGTAVQLILDATGVGNDKTKYKIHVKYDNSSTQRLSIVNVTQA